MRKTTKKSFFNTLLQWIDQLRPRYCCICQLFVEKSRTLSPSLDLCSSCMAQFPTRYWQANESGESGYHLCARCGNDQFVSSSIVCPVCDPLYLPFQTIVVPYRLEYPMQEIIHEFKYRKRLHLGRMLGQLLAFAVRLELETDESVSIPDVLLPVPMAENKFSQRGLNSAAVIALSCAREMGLRCEPNWASRYEDIGSLAGLPRSVRQLRIRGVYCVSENVKGLHIGIVDDVLTSGATASELARECLDTGASAVSLWVIARTPAG